MHIIHNGNYPRYINPLIGGERKCHGLIPRNPDTHPVGFYSTIQAVDFPLIPQSEWKQRCADLKASGSDLISLRRAANVPILDQNGKGYSHTEDTEVLTEKGWVRWPDWNHTDLLATVNPVTHEMEFQVATEWHASEYSGEMYHSTNRRLDFGVTNYHRMYVRKWDESKRTLSDRYSFQNAESLGWYVGLLPAPSGWRGTDLVEIEVPGSHRFDGDNFIAMLSLIVSDGYAGGSEKGGNVVSFCCFDERYDKVAALANRLGFKEQTSRKGVWTLTDTELAAWVRTKCYVGSNLGAVNKCVPDIVKIASARQIAVFLSWFGDQAKESAQPVFYSSSKRLIDDLQELLLRIGKRGTIRSRPAKDIPFAGCKAGVIHSKEAYVLTIAEMSRLCLDRKKHVETDRYRGLVYCATVPNGLLVTRRNGSVLISGNCWAHSTTAAVMTARAVMGEPTVELSAYMVACIVKSYQDEGGWGAESADFISRNGVPSSAFWAQRSMSRSNDTAAMRANAALHKITGVWADLSQAQYDRNLSFAQYATLWLSRCGTVDDHNWWSHSIHGLTLVDGAQLFDDQEARDEDTGKLYDAQEWDHLWGMDDPVTAGFGKGFANSWGTSYGDGGYGALAASKATPDGGLGVLVTSPSPT